MDFKLWETQDMYTACTGVTSILSHLKTQEQSLVSKENLLAEFVFKWSLEENIFS